MDIVFIGTPDYACLPLQALVDAGHTIKLAITQPDKPKDRGKKLQKSPVKEKAEELGIPVLTPAKIRNNEEVFEAIRAAKPDFVVVYSYGKILPKEILEAPKYECINIHASLLPKYRGAAPIHCSVWDGEEETGITIMRMEEGLDTGPMYVTASTKIGRKTSAMLYQELSEIGAKILVESLPKIADGSLKPVEQVGESNYAEMVYKAQGEIDYSKTPREIDCLVRAFNDFPVAWTKLGEEVLKIYEVYPEFSKESAANLPEYVLETGAITDRENSPSGTVVSTGKEGIRAACKDGFVLIKKLQAPGKKVMETSAYLLGNKIEIGTKLG